MGRNQYNHSSSSSSNFRVQVGKDGRRRTYNDEDYDSRVYVARGRNRGGGGGGNFPNRTWHKNNSGGDVKHVSFERRGAGGGGIKKRLGPRTGNSQQGPANLKHIIVEEDDDMSHGGQDRRQAGRARPQGRGAQKGGRSRGRGRGAYVSPSMVIRRAGGTAPALKSWHKVVLNNTAARYEKNEILLAIKNACTGHKFAPICFVKQGPHNIFHVETRSLADELRKLSPMTMPDQFQLQMTINPSAPPQVSLDDAGLEKVKAVMSSRYDPATRLLNLNTFHDDVQFYGEPVFAPLYRSQVMKPVVGILGENLPELHGIDLGGNKLRVMDHLPQLAEKAQDVKLLYLANNSINDLKELERLKSWKLLDLNLEGNPLKKSYLEDTVAYQRDIRRIFPSLVKLDNAELPKLITFDDDDETSCKLPATLPKMSCSPDAESLVATFVQEYIRLYDSDEREGLINAYSDEAVMSMAASYPQEQITHGHASLRDYISESRNLFRLDHVCDHRRHKLLRQGKLSIVSFLNDLPKTEHDLNSFTLDIPFCTPKLLTFTITGVFRERSSKNNKPPLRHFNRSFVVVPQGQGFCIVNETLFITIPTKQQTRAAFAEAKPAPVQAATTTAATPAAAPAVSDADKHVMVAQLAEKTGMNNQFTIQCLESGNWNLNAAYEAYLTAQREGKIPIEAYEK